MAWSASLTIRVLPRLGVVKESLSLILYRERLMLRTYTAGGVVSYYPSFLFQDVLEGADGTLLHGRQYMAVSVQGNSYRGVTKQFRDDLRINVSGQKQSGAGVPQVVEAGGKG
jgi:hypothetical protein